MTPKAVAGTPKAIAGTPEAIAGAPEAIAGDIQMQSPQNSPPALHGSSCTSGGAFQGSGSRKCLECCRFF
jgi:hypothetical protein